MPFTAAVGNLLVRRNNALQSTSSSSSDEEWNTILQKYNREKRKLRPRIIDYDNVITRYSDEEFKRSMVQVHLLRIVDTPRLHWVGITTWICM